MLNNGGISEGLWVGEVLQTAMFEFGGVFELVSVGDRRVLMVERLFLNMPILFDHCSQCAHLLGLRECSKSVYVYLTLNNSELEQWLISINTFFLSGSCCPSVQK